MGLSPFSCAAYWICQPSPVVAQTSRSPVIVRCSMCQPWSVNQSIIGCRSRCWSMTPGGDQSRVVLMS
ncbi:hypothetical protein DEJ00_06475 [Curtobacterium sp. MCLR17_039]|nr:hypothetical protein DEJ00_06475 [Curtobacterium sp. MCLR17_039]